MKRKILLVTTLLLLSFLAKAQRPDHSAVCRQAMSKLASLAGDWEGKATMMTAKGPMEINQTEHIEWRLQDLLLVIEGTGRMPSGEIGFQALAIVNYDPIEQRYGLHSFVKEGNTALAYFSILSPNQFEWGFDVPGGKSKYTITLDPDGKNWKEIGEFSADGVTWRKFIDLVLIKK